MKKFMDLSQVLANNSVKVKRLANKYDNLSNGTMYTIMASHSYIDDYVIMHRYFSYVTNQIFARYIAADELKDTKSIAEFYDIFNGIIMYTMDRYHTEGQLHSAMRHFIYECLHLLYDVNVEYQLYSFKFAGTPAKRKHLIIIEPIIKDDSSKIDINIATSFAKEINEIFNYENISDSAEDLICTATILSNQWINNIDELSYLAKGYALSMIESFETDMYNARITQLNANGIETTETIIDSDDKENNKMVVTNLNDSSIIDDDEEDDEYSEIDEEIADIARDSGCIKFEGAKDMLITHLKYLSYNVNNMLNPSPDDEGIKPLNPADNRYDMNITERIYTNFYDTDEDVVIPTYAVQYYPEVSDSNIDFSADTISNNTDATTATVPNEDNIWQFDTYDYFISSRVMDFKDYIDDMLNNVNKLDKNIDTNTLSKMASGYKHGIKINSVNNNAIHFSIANKNLIFTLGEKHDKIEKILNAECENNE